MERNVAMNRSASAFDIGSASASPAKDERADGLTITLSERRPNYTAQPLLILLIGCLHHSPCFAGRGDLCELTGAEDCGSGGEALGVFGLIFFAGFVYAFVRDRSFRGVIYSLIFLFAPLALPFLLLILGVIDKVVSFWLIGIFYAAQFIWRETCLEFIARLQGGSPPFIPPDLRQTAAYTPPVDDNPKVHSGKRSPANLSSHPNPNFAEATRSFTSTKGRDPAEDEISKAWRVKTAKAKERGKAWHTVVAEIEGPLRRPELWQLALSKAIGDVCEARSNYIAWRMAELVEASNVSYGVDRTTTAPHDSAVSVQQGKCSNCGRVQPRVSENCHGCRVSFAHGSPFKLKSVEIFKAPIRKPFKWKLVQRHLVRGSVGIPLTRLRIVVGAVSGFEVSDPYNIDVAWINKSEFEGDFEELCLLIRETNPN
jgi:hypothetical protein